MLNALKPLTILDPLAVSRSRQKVFPNQAMKMPPHWCPGPKESDISGLFLWLQARPGPELQSSHQASTQDPLPLPSSHWPRCGAPGTVLLTGRYPGEPAESRSAAPSYRQMWCSHRVEGHLKGQNTWSSLLLLFPRGGGPQNTQQSSMWNAWESVCSWILKNAKTNWKLAKYNMDSENRRLTTRFLRNITIMVSHLHRIWGLIGTLFSFDSSDDLAKQTGNLPGHCSDNF